VVLAPQYPRNRRIMPGSTFQTNPIDLHKVLEDCQHVIIQLPDFQQSWVWDEDRIKTLIASISRAFPVGALMTLDTGGKVNFRPRPVEGTPPAAKTATVHSLLLDGHQRMTSMYQAPARHLPEGNVARYVVADAIARSRRRSRCAGSSR
jgi:hypothetical protein